jgi:NitT/TauT family transport system permease protein
MASSDDRGVSIARAGLEGAMEGATPELAGLDALDLAVAAPGLTGRFAARGWRAVWPKLAAVALVLVVWEALYLGGWKHFIFPGPASTLGNLWHQAGTGELWHAIGITLMQLVIGYALALVIGTVVGALVSRIPPLRAAIGSAITGLQTMPSLVWLPFAIILYGPTTSAILFVVVLAAAPSIANGLIAGIDYTPPVLMKAGTLMGLRRLSLYRHLILPASLPTYVAGLKQGYAFAWHGLLAGELIVLIANEPSLGVLLNSDQVQADMTSVMAIMIVILILGIAADGLFGFVNQAIRRRWGLT